MPREISSGLADLLAKHSVNTQTTLDIIRTSGKGDPLYLATDSFTIDTREYSADLLRADQIQQSIAVSTNRVTVRISNVDKVFGGIVAGESLIRAVAILGRFFRDEQTAEDEPDTGEWAELFRGEIIPIEFTESEAVLEIVHDLTAAGFCVANWTLSPPCQTVFKQADTCGYGGAETTCNKLRRSKNGCAGRGNEHRFVGMEFPDIQLSAPPPPIGGGGGGFPTGSCPRRDQYVLARGDSDFTRIVRRAEQIKPGHHLWDPVNGRWNKVLSAEIVAGQQIWEITAENGASKYVSATHPIIRNAEDTSGLAVQTIKPNEQALTWSRGKLMQSTVRSVRRTAERADVVKIETDGNHIYCIGERPDAMIVGHNSKPAPEG